MLVLVATFSRRDAQSRAPKSRTSNHVPFDPSNWASLLHQRSRDDWKRDEQKVPLPHIILTTLNLSALHCWSHSGPKGSHCSVSMANTTFLFFHSFTVRISPLTHHFYYYYYHHFYNYYYYFYYYHHFYIQNFCSELTFVITNPNQVIGGELQERLIPVPYSKTSTDQAVRPKSEILLSCCIRSTVMTLQPYVYFYYSV